MSRSRSSGSNGNANTDEVWLATATRVPSSAHSNPVPVPYPPHATCGSRSSSTHSVSTGRPIRSVLSRLVPAPKFVDDTRDGRSDRRRPDQLRRRPQRLAACPPLDERQGDSDGRPTEQSEVGTREATFDGESHLVVGLDQAEE